MSDDPLNDQTALGGVALQPAADATQGNGAPSPDGDTQQPGPSDSPTLAPDPIIRLAALPTLSSPSTGGGSPPPVKGTPVGIGQSYSLDATRERIAIFLLSILFLIILLQAAGGVIFAADCWKFNYCTRAKSAFDMIVGTMGPIFTAMIGLVGSVVGFYFGSQKQTV